jgi:hypothetical protein
LQKHFEKAEIEKFLQELSEINQILSNIRIKILEDRIIDIDAILDRETLTKEDKEYLDFYRKINIGAI